MNSWLFGSVSAGLMMICATAVGQTAERNDSAPSAAVRLQEMNIAGIEVPPYLGPIVVDGVREAPSHWQPGGYSARRGRPYYFSTPHRHHPVYSVHNVTGVPWGIDHSAYRYHFGPGYYRHSEGGHYRFPYYTYRAPWYFPGHPIYNRDTNRPW